MDLKRNKTESKEKMANNDQVEPETHSEKAISTFRGIKPRVPQFMRNTLRGRFSLNRQSPYIYDEGTNRQSNIGTIITSGIIGVINNLRDVTLCEICQTEIKKPKSKDLEVFMCNCEHKYSFCESCLHHYVIHKIKTFQEVPCPHDGCPVVLDTSTNFFKNLPLDVQKHFKKIAQFYQVSKDPNKRMCPKQNCQGIIKTTQGNTMVCDHCKAEFCDKCLLGVHEGECDSHQVAFFEKNLHYQQCKKCKFVIQKNQGCNHMTCRCGYQFCYVCGSDWNETHYGDHGQVPNPNNQVLFVGDIHIGPPHIDDQNQPCCECLGRDCRQLCCCILKAPIKLVLFLLFGVFALVMIMTGPFLVAICMLVVAVVAGMFGFSFEMISRMEGVTCLLGILFLPFIMIAGIGSAFSQVFCPVVGLVCGVYCQMLSPMAECIYEL